VTNDVEPKRDVDYEFDALEPDAIRDHFGTDPQFDTVVFDPPFSIYMGVRKYDGNWTGEDAMLKDQLADIVKPGGRVFSFGYNTCGLGDKRGFEKQTAIIWNHPGRNNDTLSIIEQKKTTTLQAFE